MQNTPVSSRPKRDIFLKPKRDDFSKLSIADLQSTEPEYERIPQISRRFGVSRTFIFQACQQGVVKNLHIKRPGAKKGILLVSVPSMRKLMESFKKSEGLENFESPEGFKFFNSFEK
jgi:hypothetical protein